MAPRKSVRPMRLMVPCRTRPNRLFLETQLQRMGKTYLRELKSLREKDHYEIESRRDG
jgi:hypothetical protein